MTDTPKDPKAPQDPLLVELVDPIVVPPHPPQTDPPHPSLKPTTTAEQDLGTAGQRHINLIWETTQMRIALSVIWVSLATAFLISIMGQFLRTAADLQLAAVVFMFGVANLVTGFYFGRTNHTKTGGVAPWEAGR